MNVPSVLCVNDTKIGYRVIIKKEELVGVYILPPSVYG